MADLFRGIAFGFEEHRQGFVGAVPCAQRASHSEAVPYAALDWQSGCAEQQGYVSDLPTASTSDVARRSLGPPMMWFMA